MVGWFYHSVGGVALILVSAVRRRVSTEQICAHTAYLPVPTFLALLLLSKSWRQGLKPCITVEERGVSWHHSTPSHSKYLAERREVTPH